jgi:hypothetical protein
VRLIPEDADAQAGADHIGKLQVADEPLVLRDVVTLQSDLQLDRLHKVPLLLLQQLLQDRPHSLPQHVVAQLRRQHKGLPQPPKPL